MRSVWANNGTRWVLRWVAPVVLIGMAAPVWGAPPDCAAAKKTFAADCVVCHMANGQGNAGIGTPNFTDPKWQAEHKDAELFDAVTNGVKGTAMPSWKGQFKPAEIDALIHCVVRGFGEKAEKAAPAHRGISNHPPA